MLWSKTYGGSADDYAYSAVENQDGSLTIVGYSLSSNGDVPSNLGMHDFFIFKITHSGELIWSRFYGGSFTDSPAGVLENNTGEFIVVGASDSNDVDITNNKGSYDFWIVKSDTGGNIIWEKSFGGSEIDEARGIASSRLVFFKGSSECPNNFIKVF